MFHHPVYLRRSLQNVAHWVWDRQGEALHYGLKLQEETITEMVLLRVARKWRQHGLVTRMFNRIEEGGDSKKGKVGNGADWEWYVQTPTCNVGFRVQAKVLSSGQTLVHRRLQPGRYEAILPNHQQTRDLIAAAKAGGFNPVYVFYNHPWVSDRGHFSSAAAILRSGLKDWGCSVASANFVLSAPDNRLATLISGMVPWDQFFGWDGQCLAASVLQEMPGDQRFLADCPVPQWLEMLDGETGLLDEYLSAKGLSGVVHLDFRRER